MSTMSVDLWAERIGGIDVNQPQLSQGGDYHFTTVSIKDAEMNTVLTIWLRGSKGVSKARDLGAALLAAADLVEGASHKDDNG